MLFSCYFEKVFGRNYGVGKGWSHYAVMLSGLTMADILRSITNTMLMSLLLLLLPRIHKIPILLIWVLLLPKSLVTFLHPYYDHWLYNWICLCNIFQTQFFSISVSRWRRNSCGVAWMTPALSLRVAWSRTVHLKSVAPGIFLLLLLLWYVPTLPEEAKQNIFFTVPGMLFLSES